MRCVLAALAMFGSLALLQPVVGLSRLPFDLDNVMPEEPPEQLLRPARRQPLHGLRPR